jgi:hypothetical protein
MPFVAPWLCLTLPMVYGPLLPADGMEYGPYYSMAGAPGPGGPSWTWWASGIRSMYSTVGPFHHAQHALIVLRNVAFTLLPLLVGNILGFTNVGTVVSTGPTQPN